ncbi:MAG: hypothetical protein QM734_17730 [Cyclobacteriaceae bacterium]
MEKSYRYLPYFLILLVPLSIAAFYRTYIVQFPHFSERNGIFTHIHAALSMIWIAMMIAQPFLIKSKNFTLHRKIGKLSYIVFPLLILSFIPQTVRIILHDDPKGVFFPVADSVLMIVFYVLAIYNRKNSGSHMRYMIAVVFVFLFPTLGRIWPIYFGFGNYFGQNTQYVIIYFTLLALIFYDKKNKKEFRPYLIALPFFVLHQIVYHAMFVWS